MSRRFHVVEQPVKRTRACSRIGDAVTAMRAGQVVIVVDDEDRESEGDLTVGEDHAAGHQLHGSVWPRADFLSDDT